MATRGFEFAYMLDGSNAVPLVRDFVLGVAAAHKIGDLMLIQSDDGYADQVVGSIDEVSGVMLEAIAAADITAGTTNGKMAVITRNQVWKCSTDAATAATALLGVKLWDTVDANTIDADDVSNGSMIVAEDVDTVNLDKDGNVVGYVVFSDTTFGNT